MTDSCRKWGLLWHSKNRTDGLQEHLLWENGNVPMFQTRHEARQFSHKKYGYILTRPDLRQEPHGWRMPRPVKIIGIQWT